MHFEIFLCLILASLTSGQDGQLLFLQPSLSNPERVHQLGLTPRYQSIVYDYITQFAGQQPPAQVRFASYPAHVEDFGVRDEPSLSDAGAKEPVTESPFKYPVQPSALLPSDFILLARSPQSQFFGHFDVVQNKNMKIGVDASSLPPLGGVVSDYVLQRNNVHENKVKRQAFQYNYGSWPFNPAQVQKKSYTATAVGNRRSAYENIESDENDGVVISAAAGPRAEENNKNCTNGTSSTTSEEAQPSVAQSKPQAIALAGAGGVAQAAPVATAVVGKEGLAIAAPSATAIAGQGAQNALGGGGEEKMKRRTASKTDETKQ